MSSLFRIRSASSFEKELHEGRGTLTKPGMRSRHVSAVRMGPTSILVVVIVLCLAVLAVLTATTASANSNMADRQASFVTDDYNNEALGQTLYAQADDVVASVRMEGGTVEEAVSALTAALPEFTDQEGVSASMQDQSLVLHIEAPSGRCLDVRLTVTPDMALSVENWNTSTTWVEDDTDMLWTGQ